METTPAKNVYQLIASVAAEVAQEGISKSRKNQQQGYQFRGIDDVYNALAPILAKHGLVILPRCISRTVAERQARGGGVLFSVVVEAEFDFVSSFDGSRHTVKTYGEAMDSADKATNKAMSAAYKYAAFQAFCIPTEGDNDADSTTHQVEAPSASKPAARTRAAASAPAASGPEMLTADEVASITALAQEVGKPIKDITAAYKVGSLNFIPRTAYQKIVARLEAARQAPAEAPQE